MTSNEGQRIDKAEQAIVGLSGRMDGFDNRLTKVEETGSETNEIAHKLLARQGGYEATRGMIPIQYIWAALGLMVSLTSVGLKMLWDSESKVDTKIENSIALEDKRHDVVDQRLERLVDAIEHLHETERADIIALRNEYDLKIKDLEKRVVANATLEERIRAMETNRFTKEEGIVLREEQAAIKEELARRSTMLERLVHDLDEHTSELDHPFKQTVELQHLRDVLNKIQEEQAKRSERVYGKE